MDLRPAAGSAARRRPRGRARSCGAPSADVRRRVRRLRRRSGLPRRAADARPARRARGERPARVWRTGWARASRPGSPRPCRERCRTRATSGSRCALRSRTSTGPRGARRRGPRFGLDPDRPTLLVFGGSQGSRRLNDAGGRCLGGARCGRGAGAARLRAGTRGPRRPRSPGSRPTSSCPTSSAWTWPTPPPTSMLCRAGAMTCAELAAVGLPAVYVPLPIGNGEQRLNAKPVVDAGGGLVVDDEACTPGYVAEVVAALVARPATGWRTMSAAAAGLRSARRRRAAGRHGDRGGRRERRHDRARARTPSAAELGPRALRGHRWRRHVRDRADHAGARRRGLGQRRQGLPRAGRAARARRRRVGRPRRGAAGRRADTVVVSTAIRPTNVEVVEASAPRPAVLHRAEALAALMAGHRSVAVAGTHGKTTTTSMLTVALQHCGVDPSFAIGGHLSDSGANAHHGSGRVFVAEADESDGSFLHYRPDIAIVTNVDPDHLDHYGDRRGLPRGVPRVRRLHRSRGAPRHLRRRRRCGRPSPTRCGPPAEPYGTYGEDAGADLRIVDLVLLGSGARFDVVLRGRRLGPVQLAVPGAAQRAERRRRAARRPRARPARRTSARGPGGLRRDPAALRAQGHGRRGARHRRLRPPPDRDRRRTSRPPATSRGRAGWSSPSSRTSTAGPGCSPTSSATALGLADEVVVMEVYAAREDPEPGVSGALVAAAVPLPPEHVRFEPSWSAVAAAAGRPGPTRRRRHDPRRR